MHLPHPRTPFAHALLRTILRAQCRAASSASNNRWSIRRENDPYKKAEYLIEYKNRAAVKLDQIHEKYQIFKKGQTVVDLGFAPGGWSEIALKHTKPGGRVVGVDLIPATPPRGVSTFQGDFRSPAVQAGVRRYLLDPERGRPQLRMLRHDEQAAEEGVAELGYIDRERMMEKEDTAIGEEGGANRGKVVDVVLSDMCEPIQRPTTGKRSLDAVYDRMVATSGNMSQDHFGSIDLCYSALSFCIDVLVPGGSFVCKYYQGSEENILCKKMLMVFESVESCKPDASRQQSRERYSVCRAMKKDVRKEDVFPDEGFMLRRP